MSVLHVYDPAECDPATGVPLGWERCRTCEGSGAKRDVPQAGRYGPGSCSACGGHGSLKAAALAFQRERQIDAEFTRVYRNPANDALTEQQREEMVSTVVRCEGCGHPASDGTWTWRDAEAERRFGTLVPERVKNSRVALDVLREGREPGLPEVHYSRCDEGCRHDGPARMRKDGGHAWHPLARGERAEIAGGMIQEASWRPVDVRTLGWPHDLRPEKLVVLCLRCYAERAR